MVRSNRRHFVRQNHRKKTSDHYEKKFKNVQLSKLEFSFVSSENSPVRLLKVEMG
jgi:hypothetical protein